VDGDGLADLIVGATDDDPNGSQSGRVFVYAGGSWELLHTFDGEAPTDHFGYRVSGLGDVDGDGHADLLAAGAWNDTGGADAGRVRVYSGRTGSVLYAVLGDDAGDQLGRGLASAGDVDGDGVPDFVAGAIHDDDGGLDAGSARVYSGVDGAALHTFHGTAAGEHQGWSVAGAGDLDGDGRDDVLVGAPGADIDAGSARAYSGADGSLLFEWRGAEPGAQLGAAVAAAGDVDGDGRPDLLLGSPGEAGRGSVRLVSGADGALLLVQFGDSQGDAFGAAVAGAGDLDGDGAADWIVGARWDDDGGAQSGTARAYSAYGRVGTPYCFGDGGGTSCPCGNPGHEGAGCATSSGSGSALFATGSTSAAADDLVCEATGLVPGQPALLFAGTERVAGGPGVGFGDGLRCAGGVVARLGTVDADANGRASWGPGLGASGGWGAGDTRHLQAWHRDPTGPCGSGFNLTNGLGVVFGG
jgi:hypothetical protein